LAKTFKRLGIKTALDVGCATGPLVKALVDVGIDSYGVDVSKWAIKNSPVTNRLSWIDLDIDKLVFPDESFDLVITTFVIEHLIDPKRALQEMFRVLKPGGYLYIVTDKEQCFASGQVGHINIRSKKSWLNLLKDIKFKKSTQFYLRFRAYYPFEKVCEQLGLTAKRLQLHKIGLIGKIILWLYQGLKYSLERQNYTFLILTKNQ
jgi:ubiquinone/menaquinone biosynthesis C-methylase UbiE